MMTNPKVLKLGGLEGLREAIIASNLTGGMWEGAKRWAAAFHIPYWIINMCWVGAAKSYKEFPKLMIDGGWILHNSARLEGLKLRPVIIASGRSETRPTWGSYPLKWEPIL